MEIIRQSKGVNYFFRRVNTTWLSLLLLFFVASSYAQTGPYTTRQLDVFVQADAYDIVTAAGQNYNNTSNPGWKYYDSQMADINKDGYKDLVTIVNGTGVNKVLVVLYEPTKKAFDNNMSNSYHALTVESGFYPEECRVADFDSDGTMDVAVLSSKMTKDGYSAGKINIYRGKSSSPYFESVISAEIWLRKSLTQVERHMEVADLNKDGKPDIVVADNKMEGYTGATYSMFFASTDFEKANIAYYTNGGSFGFTSKIILSAYNSDVRDMAVGDLNGDGYPEIVAKLRNPSGAGVHIFKNLGGSFTSPGAGFNNSGDGSIKSSLTSEAKILKLSTGVNYSYDVNAVGPYMPSVIADINNDGFMDIVTQGIYQTAGATVEVFFGTSNTFGSSFYRSTSPGVYKISSIDLLDVNTDGLKDVVVGDENNEYPTVITYAGNRSFTDYSYRQKSYIYNSKNHQKVVSSFHLPLLPKDPANQYIFLTETGLIYSINKLYAKMNDPVCVGSDLEGEVGGAPSDTDISFSPGVEQTPPDKFTGKFKITGISTGDTPIVTTLKPPKLPPLPTIKFNLTPTIISLPTLQQVQGPDKGCAGSTYEYYLSSGSTANTYKWEFIQSSGSASPPLMTTNQYTKVKGTWTISSGSGKVSVTELKTYNVTSNFTGSGTTMQCARMHTPLDITFLGVSPSKKTITGDPIVCDGDSQLYSISPSGGSSVKWLLDKGDSRQNDALSPSMSKSTWPFGAGIYTVTALEINGSCQTWNEMAVQVIGGLNPFTITGTMNVCKNSIASFSVVSQNATARYNWTFKNGLATSPSFSNQGYQDVVSTGWNNYGLEAIEVKESVQVTATKFCYATVNAYVKVYGAPSAKTISGATYACMDENKAFSISNETIIGNIGSVPQTKSYTWNISTSNSYAVSAVMSQAGSNDLQVNEKWIFTDVDGTNDLICEKTHTGNIFVFDPSTREIQGKSGICSSGAEIYSISAKSLASGYTGTDSYVWTSSPALTISSSGSSISVTFPGMGNYTLTVKETWNIKNSGGSTVYTCDISTSKLVQVINTPNPDIVLTQNNFCVGTDFTLPGVATPNSYGATETFNWAIGGLTGVSDQATNITTTLAQSGQLQVKLEQVWDFGDSQCKKDKTVTITVFDRKIADAIVGDGMVCNVKDSRQYCVDKSNMPSTNNHVSASVTRTYDWAINSTDQNVNATCISVDWEIYPPGSYTVKVQETYDYKNLTGTPSALQCKSIPLEVKIEVIKPPDPPEISYWIRKLYCDNDLADDFTSSWWTFYQLDDPPLGGTTVVSITINNKYVGDKISLSDIMVPGLNTILVSQAFKTASGSLSCFSSTPTVYKFNTLKSPTNTVQILGNPNICLGQSLTFSVTLDNIHFPPTYGGLTPSATVYIYKAYIPPASYELSPYNPFGYSSYAPVTEQIDVLKQTITPSISIGTNLLFSEIWFYENAKYPNGSTPYEWERKCYTDYQTPYFVGQVPSPTIRGNKIDCPSSTEKSVFWGKAYEQILPLMSNVLFASPQMTGSIYAQNKIDPTIVQAWSYVGSFGSLLNTTGTVANFSWGGANSKSGNLTLQETFTYNLSGSYFNAPYILTCSAQTQTTIKVISSGTKPIVPDFTGPWNTCAGSTVTYNITSPNPLDSSAKYLWYVRGFDTPIISNTQSVDIYYPYEISSSASSLMLAYSTDVTDPVEGLTSCTTYAPKAVKVYKAFAPTPSSSNQIICPYSVVKASDPYSQYLYLFRYSYLTFSYNKPFDDTGIKTTSYTIDGGIVGPIDKTSYSDRAEVEYLSPSPAGIRTYTLNTEWSFPSVSLVCKASLSGNLIVMPTSIVTITTANLGLCWGTQVSITYTNTIQMLPYDSSFRYNTSLVDVTKSAVIIEQPRGYFSNSTTYSNANIFNHRFKAGNGQISYAATITVNITDRMWVGPNTYSCRWKQSAQVKVYANPNTYLITGPAGVCSGTTMSYSITTTNGDVQSFMDVGGTNATISTDFAWYLGADPLGVKGNQASLTLMGVGNYDLAIQGNIVFDQLTSIPSTLYCSSLGNLKNIKIYDSPLKPYFDPKLPFNRCDKEMSTFVPKFPGGAPTNVVNDAQDIYMNGHLNPTDFLEYRDNFGMNTITLQRTWVYDDDVSCKSMQESMVYRMFPSPYGNMITGDKNLCAGSQLNFTVTTTEPSKAALGLPKANGVIPIATYDWWVKDALNGEVAKVTNTAETITPTLEKEGRYYVNGVEYWTYNVGPGDVVVCSNTIAVTEFRAYATPSRTIISGEFLQCNTSSSTTLNAYNYGSVNSLGSTANISYVWQNQTGTDWSFSSTSAQKTTVFWTINATHTVITLTETFNYTALSETPTTLACSAGTSTIIDVFVSPMPQPIVGPEALCATSTQQYYEVLENPPPNLNVGAFTVTNNFSWTYSGTNGSISAYSSPIANSVSVSYNVSGIGTLSYTQSWKYDNGSRSKICSAISTKTIHVFAVPAIPKISGNENTCGYGVEIYNVATPTTPAASAGVVPSISYYWEAPIFTQSGVYSLSTFTVTISSTQSDSGTVSLTENWVYIYNSNIYECKSGLFTAIINVFETPKPTILGPLGLCSGVTATYQTQTATAPKPNFTYAYYWSKNTLSYKIQTNTINTLDFSFDKSSAIQTISVNEIWNYSSLPGLPNSLSCSKSNTLGIIIYQSPVSNAVSGTIHLCLGVTEEYTVTQTTTSTLGVFSNPLIPTTFIYKWKNTPSNIVSTGTSNGLRVSDNITWVNKGIQTVTMVEYWQYADGSQCPNTNTLRVHIYDSPSNLQIVNHQRNMCLGSSANVTFTALEAINLDGLTLRKEVFDMDFAGIKTSTQNKISLPVSAVQTGTNTLTLQQSWIYDFDIGGKIQTLTCKTSTVQPLAIYDREIARVLLGKQDVCSGTLGEVYVPNDISLPWADGGSVYTTYTWTLNSTDISANSTSSETRNWRVSGVHQLKMVENFHYSALTGLPASLWCISPGISITVRVYDTPLQKKVVGNEQVCSGTTWLYSVSSTVPTASNGVTPSITYDWLLDFSVGAMQAPFNTVGQTVHWKTASSTLFSNTEKWLYVTPTNPALECTNTNTLNVSVYHIPVINPIVGSNFVCVGTLNNYQVSNTIANVSTNGKTPNITYQWEVVGTKTIVVNPVTYKNDISWSKQGLATATVEEIWTYTGLTGGPISTLICSQVNTQTVLVFGEPQPKVITGVVNVCIGAVEHYIIDSTLPFTANAYPTSKIEYLWNLSSRSSESFVFSSTTSQTIGWIDDATKTLTVIEYWSFSTPNSLTCSATVAVKAVDTYPIPSPNAISGNDKVCIYTNQVYTTTATLTPTAHDGLKPNISYVWTMSNTLGIATPTANINRIYWNKEGFSALTMVEQWLYSTKTITCLRTNVLNPITIHQLPVLNTISGTIHICLGSTHLYSITNTNSSSNVFTTPLIPTNYLFQWENTPTNILSSGTVNGNKIENTITWNVKGIHTITLAETWKYADGSQCSNTNTLRVNVYDNPHDLQIVNTPQNLCIGVSANVSYTSQKEVNLDGLTLSKEYFECELMGIKTLTYNKITLPFSLVSTGTSIVTLIQSWQYSVSINNSIQTLVCNTSTNQPLAVFDRQVAKLIYGKQDVCSGTLGEKYWLDNITLPWANGGSVMPSYTWTLNSSEVSTNNTATETRNWNKQGIHSLKVIENFHYSGLSGTPSSLWCISPGISITVRVYEVPKNKIIVGNEQVCSGTTWNYTISDTLVLASNSVVPVIEYNWLLDAMPGLMKSPMNSLTQTIHWRNASSTILTNTEKWKYNTPTNSNLECIITNTLNVSIYQTPDKNPIIGSDYVCIKSSNNFYVANTTAVASTNNKTPDITYLWLVEGTKTESVAPSTYQNTIVWSQSGIASLTVVESWKYSGLTGGSITSLTCANVNSKTVFVFGTPTQKTINGAINVCSGATENYTISSTSNFSINGYNTTSIRYLWSMSAIATETLLTASTISQTITWYDDASKTFSIVELWTYGTPIPLTCSATIASKTVDTYPIPVIRPILGLDNICKERYAVYTATVIPKPTAHDGLQPTITYNWTMTVNLGQQTPTQNTTSIYWNNSGSTALIMVEQWDYTTKTLTCLHTNVLNPVKVYAVPTKKMISGTLNICLGEGAYAKIESPNVPILSNGVFPEQTYNWTFEPIESNIVSGTDINKQILYVGEGVKSITANEDWYYSGLSGVVTEIHCSVEHSPHFINVFLTPPKKVIAGVLNTCVGLGYNYSVTVSYIGTFVSSEQNGTISYKWNLDSIGNITASSTNKPDIVWHTAGSSTLTVGEYWSYANGHVCSATHYATDNIHSYAQPPANPILGLNNLCFGVPSTIFMVNNTTPTLSAGVLPNITYTWIVNPTLVSLPTDMGQTSIELGINNPGITSLTLIESWIFSSGATDTVCKFTNTSTLAVYESPVSNPILGNFDICQSTTVNYAVEIKSPTSNGISPLVTFSWTVASATIATQDNIQPSRFKWINGGQTTLNLDEIWTYLLSTGTPTQIKCAYTNSATVYVTPIPEIGNKINGPTIVCQGVTTTYNVVEISDLTYSWGLDPILGQMTSNRSRAEVYWTTVGSTRIDVSAFRQEARATAPVCSASLTLNIKVYESPPHRLIDGPHPVCSSDEYKRTYTVDVPQPAGHIYTFTLDGYAPGFTIVNQTVNQMNVLWRRQPLPKSYTLTLVDLIDNEAKCLSTSTLNVVVNPTPEDFGIFGPDLSCSRDLNTKYVYNSAITKTINDRFVWTLEGYMAAVTYTKITNDDKEYWISWGEVTSPETYTLTLTNWFKYSDGMECAYGKSKKIVLNELPTPSITPTTRTVCSGKQNDKFAVRNILTKRAYLWNIPLGGQIVGSASETTVKINWDPISVNSLFSLTLRETNLLTQCKAMVTATVNIVRLDAPSITTNDNAICGGTQNTRYQISNTYAQDKIRWLVSSHGEIASTNPRTTSVSINWKSTFTRTVGTVQILDTLRIADDGDLSECISLGVKTVTLYASPRPKITGNDAVCEKVSFKITDQSTVHLDYIKEWTWTMPDGTQYIRTDNSGVIGKLDVLGVYTVTLKLVSNRDCEYTQRFPINVYPNPIAKISNIPKCFAGGALLFSDESEMSDGSKAPLQATWSFGDGGKESLPLALGTQSRVVAHTYVRSGNYIVTVKVTSDKGCVDRTTTSVYIPPGAPVSDFSFASDKICSGSELEFTNLSIPNDTPISKIEWVFDTNKVPLEKLEDLTPVYGEKYIAQYDEFFTPATKSVTIRKVDYYNEKCLIQQEKNIVLQALPQIQFDPLPPACNSDPEFMVIDKASVINSVSGTWSFTGDGLNDKGYFVPTSVEDGEHKVKATYISDFGCKIDAEQTVVIWHVPEIDLPPVAETIEKTPLLFSVSVYAKDKVSYEWFPKAELEEPYSSITICRTEIEQPFTFHATTEYGCTNSKTIFIYLRKLGETFSAFSPNGDGVNDTWMVENADYYPGAVMEVYTRYGELVYMSGGEEWVQKWDGTFNGRELPVGTYFWVLRPKNGLKPMTGFVSIIK